ncbi:hypothetical protein FB545_3756 [Peribacillus frigoritolerans]|nr:hypothetical protein FB545_3756 [Peribacillus frigoritolerans]
MKDIPYGTDTFEILQFNNEFTDWLIALLKVI